VGLPRLSKIWRAFTDWIVAIAERASERTSGLDRAAAAEKATGFRKGLLGFDRSGSSCQVYKLDAVRGAALVSTRTPNWRGGECVVPLQVGPTEMCLYDGPHGGVSRCHVESW
jgi:hypothetical protein